MKEDRRQRGSSNRKLLAAVAITALFLSGSAPTAARTASERSNEAMEQMQTQTVMVTVVDANGEPIIGANVIEKVQPMAASQTWMENQTGSKTQRHHPSIIRGLYDTRSQSCSKFTCHIKR